MFLPIHLIKKRVSSWTLLVVLIATYLFNGDSKCLIISVDNRELSEKVNANAYASITSVINLEYAKYHNYDFAYIENNALNLVQVADNKYPNNHTIPAIGKSKAPKDAPTAFHVGLRQFRAASWAKLPAIWELLVTIGPQYDYIWYLDSDACISPMHRERTVEMAVKSWEKQGAVLRGNKKVSESSLIFFSNKPWRGDMPCAGSIIFRPQLMSTERILRQWWDYDLPVKNFAHFHEQDALWHLIEAEEESGSGTASKYLLNSTTYSIVSDQQFPSEWMRYEDLWVCHVATYNFDIRLPILLHFLFLLNLDQPEPFALAVRAVKDHHSVKMISLDITERMEARSRHDLDRVSSFPAHNVSSQDEWYSRNQSRDVDHKLGAQQFYNNRLIHRRGAFYLVCSGQRYGFDSWEAFIDLGFSAAMSHLVPPTIDLDKVLPLAGVIAEGSRIKTLIDTKGQQVCRGNAFVPLLTTTKKAGVAIITSSNPRIKKTDVSSSVAKRYAAAVAAREESSRVDGSTRKNAA